jgi:subtilase family serine protease
MFRCVPDIAMHANADDLPIIYTLNGGSVYVGGTSVASAMFAGFLAVVQSHNPINYFVNPIFYDNYTSPSPLFNEIIGLLLDRYSTNFPVKIPCSSIVFHAKTNNISL